MLTTAGGLLFAGGSDGIFSAYNSKTGKKLWSIDVKTGIVAPAITYTVDGEQYVAVAAGWGGSGGLGATGDMQTALQKYGNNQGRIFAFKLGGAQQIAALPSEMPENLPKPPDEKIDTALGHQRLRPVPSPLRGVPWRVAAILRRGARPALGAAGNLGAV